MARLVSLSLVLLFLILEVVIANVQQGRNLKEEMEYSTFKRRYDICHLPVKYGNCRHGVNSWYFNHNIKGCVKFTYRLCGGNANRFYSEKECMEFCKDYRNTLKFSLLGDQDFGEEQRY